MQPPRAFTLIELLVVIAIIGILSSVVLASLGTARERGNDTAVKKAMLEARTQAEIFYAANNSRYSASLSDTATNVCSATGVADGVKSMYDSFNSAAGIAGITTVQTVYNQAGASGRATCHACPPGISAGSCGGANSNAWGIEVPLKSGGFWCVDSSGFNGYNASSMLASGDARCI